MTQSELNHAIARQTGESVTEISRHGFSLLSDQPAGTDEPEDSDDLLLLITTMEEAESSQRSVFSIQ